MTFDQETAVGIGLLILVTGLVGLLVVRIARSHEVEVAEDLPVPVSADRATLFVAQVLQALPGVRCEPVSPTSYRLVRKVIPTWSMVFLLLGLVGVVLMLLVRQDRATSAELLEGPHGVSLRLLGSLERKQVEAIRAAFSAVPVQA